MLIGFHCVTLLLWCWLLFSCSLSDFDDIDFYNNWAAKIRILLQLILLTFFGFQSAPDTWEYISWNLSLEKHSRSWDLFKNRHQVQMGKQVNLFGCHIIVVVAISRSFDQIFFRENISAIVMLTSHEKPPKWEVFF